jgi:O-methyltransferase involved in polyketide biosynthesis
MRAHTGLPYARAAAEHLLGAPTLAAELARLATAPGTSMRAAHFEARYRSIDRVLDDTGARRILELGAGFSLRGLALARRAAVDYLDTDLAPVVATKRELIAALAGADAPLVGDLRLHALDALDGEAFRAALDGLPQGPVSIVNEGLLMYLDSGEKRRLASHVRDALQARGGAWITADIYVRAAVESGVAQDERLHEFVATHNIEANKFASHVEAEELFAEVGLRVERRLALPNDPSRETWVLVAR